MRRTLFALSSFAIACSAASGDKGKAPGILDPDGSANGDGANFDVVGFEAKVPDGLTGDPKTCEGAAAMKSYIGCDYWPTVVANNVWSIFDFAVVVANAGDEPAEIVVTGPSTSKKVTVPPGELSKIFLPWVMDLKGGESDTCGSVVAMNASVKSTKGAYHLVSSKPVTVYQFSALEYKGEGGPSGKSWSNCPGNKGCGTGGPIGCFSFTNDASLLLPSTAMTGTYRVTGQHGWDESGPFGSRQPVANPYVAITATQDGTSVTVRLGKRGKVMAGGGIPATDGGGTINLTLDAGDVAEVVGEALWDVDLSGSLVQANKPVQVIAGMPCIQVPIGERACDHVEESVFPAETLGKDYFVTVPTGPNGQPVGHMVRIYGNVDGTKLTYAPSAPTGAPSVIDAGEVFESFEVTSDFRVTGSESFAVASFMYGAQWADAKAVPPTQKGDPSQSLATAVEQYRKRYIFLAPDDYDVSFVDVVHPDATTITIDGTVVSVSAKPLGTTGFSVSRVKLGSGKQGAHELTATKPVGIQVMGYGSYTSYQYPGGLDLKAIAPAPVK